MTERAWKISDIGGLLKNSLIAILRGELLLKLNAGRFFIHIAYTFLLLGIMIWASLRIETSMAKVEKNKAALKELEIVHSQKLYDLTRLQRRDGVTQRLQEMGSDIREAGEPAAILK